jgi:probable F420-dependent oxidoreductase
MYRCLKLESEINCGVVIPALHRREILEYARRVEAAGFDSIWASDHVSFHVPIMESLTMLSFMAAVTERVRLATGVYLLPLRHPTITAKITATLDVLCDGRLTLGVGVGGEFPPEFEACGIPVAERGPRSDESIEILRSLWTGENSGYSGRFFDFGPVAIAPRPVQSGGPPIIVGGRKAPSLRRAGQYGDGYISHMCSAEQFRDNMQIIDGHAQRFGRGDVSFDSTAFIFTFPDASYERALDRAAAMLESIYRRPFRDAAKKYCLLGRPEDFIEQPPARLSLRNSRIGRDWLAPRCAW